jgi:hypothetical protein
MFLHGALKALKRLDGVGHGFRGNKAGLEDTAAEARDFPIFVNASQPVSDYFCDLQPAGVGTDVDCGKRGHDLLK